MTEIVYSRIGEGNVPVEVDSEGQQTVYRTLGKEFSSVRQLLIFLTGHPTGRNWSFSRYFRTEAVPRAQNLPPEGGSVLELFSNPKSRYHTVQVPTTDQSPALSTVDTKAPGIDLEHRGHEVVKILYKGFGRWISTNGYDPEEVIQEVYKGILVRNQGDGAWNPKRSSFGHYVWMVCRSILSNYHRKKKRQRHVEQVGIPAYDNGERGTIDVAESETYWSDDDLTRCPDATVGIIDLVSYLTNHPQCQDSTGQMAVQLLPLVQQGYNKVEMARYMDVSRPTIDRSLRLLKKLSTQWAEGR